MTWEVAVFAGLSLVSTAITASAQRAEGEAQAQIYETQAMNELRQAQAALADAELMALEAESARIEAAQYDQQAELVEVETLQEENIRMDELRRQLSAQRAQAAAQGVSVTGSRSFFAIQEDTEEAAQSDVRTIRLLGSVERQRLTLAQEQSFRSMEATAINRRQAAANVGTGLMNRASAKSAASSARRAGGIRAAGTLFTNATSFFQTGATSGWFGD